MPRLALSEREENLIRGIPSEQYLDEYFEISFGILLAGKEAPEAILPAAKAALDGDEPRLRLRGITFLARFEETRESAIDALAAWDEWARERLERLGPYFSGFSAPRGYGLAENLKIHGRGIFHGHGWGRERQRRSLHRLVGPMLRGGGWSFEAWRALLGAPLFAPDTSTPAELDGRIRDVVAEYFFGVAKDPNEPLSRRRAAITAIARAQALVFARDLGKFLKDRDLVEVTRRAQQRLQEVDRVGDLATDIALDLSMRGFLEASS